MEKLQLDEALRELLRLPQREFIVTLPVKMDDGKVQIFHAYRVQYNSARGPTKGGLRWHPDETIDTVCEHRAECIHSGTPDGI